jgi:hypothetical protein
MNIRGGWSRRVLGYYIIVSHSISDAVEIIFLSLLCSASTIGVAGSALPARLLT